MANISEELLDEILSLPSDLRAILVDKLIQSLNLPTSKEIERMWIEEAKKRSNEIKTNKVKTIPGEQVFSDIRSRLNR